MGLHLTPAMLEQAYSYLLTTPPFNKWKLPAVDDVEFHVTWHGDMYGDCSIPARIRISACRSSMTHKLVETMAHEMIHLHLMRTDARAHHGARFKRCAAMVCRKHGFDPKTF